MQTGGTRSASGELPPWSAISDGVTELSHVGAVSPCQPLGHACSSQLFVFLGCFFFFCFLWYHYNSFSWSFNSSFRRGRTGNWKAFFCYIFQLVWDFKGGLFLVTTTDSPFCVLQNIRKKRWAAGWMANAVFCPFACSCPVCAAAWAPSVSVVCSLGSSGQDFGQKRGKGVVRRNCRSCKKPERWSEIENHEWSSKGLVGLGVSFAQNHVSIDAITSFPLSNNHKCKNVGVLKNIFFPIFLN